MFYKYIWLFFFLYLKFILLIVIRVELLGFNVIVFILFLCWKGKLIWLLLKFFIFIILDWFIIFIVLLLKFKVISLGFIWRLNCFLRELLFLLKIWILFFVFIIVILFLFGLYIISLWGILDKNWIGLDFCLLLC